MPLLRRILLRWIQLAGVATACALLSYYVLQQAWRKTADDPQIQLARDAVTRLVAGDSPTATVGGLPPTDFASSWAPFLMTIDPDGHVVASSGRLHGGLRTVPAGVFTAVRQSGEERVSWQPEPGVRLAAVVEAYPGGFVVAGRSLVPSESRTAEMGDFILLAWLGMLLGLGALVTATEILMARAG